LLAYYRLWKRDLRKKDVTVPNFSYLFSLFQTCEQGADTILYAALSPDLEGRGGLYLDNCQEAKSNDVSYIRKDEEELWKRTCAMIECKKEKWQNTDASAYFMITCDFTDPKHSSETKPVQ
jgi:hypothetical protein